MINFGYGINTDRQIDYDANDHSVGEQILALEPSFDICISCGTCTATCTSGQFTQFNFRQILIHIKRGEIFHIQKEIQNCMFCGKCILACPRGVNTRNLVLAIQKVLNSHA
jgi:heterodisulfide reductase subunit C